MRIAHRVPDPDARGGRCGADSGRVSGAGGTGSAGVVAAGAHAGQHLAQRAPGARLGAQAARRTEDRGAPVRRHGARFTPGRHVGAGGGRARCARGDPRAAHRGAALRGVAGSDLADAAARHLARRRRPVAADRRDARHHAAAGRKRSGTVRAHHARAVGVLPARVRSGGAGPRRQDPSHRGVARETSRDPSRAAGVSPAGHQAIGGAAAAGPEPAAPRRRTGHRAPGSRRDLLVSGAHVREPARSSSAPRPRTGAARAC